MLGAKPMDKAAVLTTFGLNIEATGSYDRRMHFFARGPGDAQQQESVGNLLAGGRPAQNAFWPGSDTLARPEGSW